MAIVSNQLYFIYSSGIPISTSMNLIISSTTNKNIKNSFINIETELLKGESLSSTLENQNLYPSLFVNMIKVGEASGEMDQILETLTIYYEKSKKYEDEIKNALIYPITVFLLLFCATLIISTFLLPSYTKIFSGLNITVPKTIKIFTTINFFIKKYFFQIMIILFALVLFVKKFLNTLEGKKIKDYILIKAPFLKKLTLKIINYRFAQTMSVLYSSGTQIIQSLDITNDLINNYFISLELEKIKNNINNGNKLSDSLVDSIYFSNMLVSLVKVGEHSGFLGESLKKASKYLELELDSMISKLNKYVEPIINLVLGAIIFFLMLMVILPSLSLGFEIM